MFIITAKFSRRRAFALAAVACLALALIVLPRACRKSAEAPAIPAETNEQRLAYLASLGGLAHAGHSSASVYLWTLPMFHCNGWCTPWAVTAAGGTHICLRAVRADAVWDAIDNLGVTNLCGAPALQLCRKGAPPHE